MPTDNQDQANSRGATTRGVASTSDAGAQPISHPFIKQYRVQFAASASSVLSTLTTFPLDSVKTRLQTFHYDGFKDCVRQTYRTEGLSGFFRGVLTPMATVTIARTVSFSAYQQSKHVYSDWLHRHVGVNVLKEVNTRGTYPTIWSILNFGAAGATAGAVITLIACPFELSKLSAQVCVLMADKKNCPDAKSHEVAKSYQNKGTIQTFANLVKHRGILGTYTGFQYHLARDTLGTSIYFVAYESAKQLLTTLGGNYSHANDVAIIAAGGLCGVASWALTYPIDSSKSIYQRNALMHSRGDVLKPVRIEWFQRQVYRGLAVSVGRSCLLNAVFFSSFESLKKQISNM